MVALQKTEGGSAPWACAPKIEIIEPSGATCAQNGARYVAKGATRGPERFAYRVGDKSHGPFFPIRVPLSDMLDRKLVDTLSVSWRSPDIPLPFSSAFPLFCMLSASAMREEFFNYSRVIPSQSIFQHCVNTA